MPCYNSDHSALYTQDATMRRMRAPCPWCLNQTVTELRSDIERHISISSQLATEVEELRAERERLRMYIQSKITVTDAELSALASLPSSEELTK